MRIGIDGACLSNRRGFGRFARQLIGALAEAPSDHEFFVFVDRRSLDEADVRVPPRFETVPVDVSIAPSRAASARGRRGLHDLWRMSRAVSKSNLDLVYFPASYSFFPVWNAGRVIVTLHDTLALAHPDLVFPTRKGRLAWRLKEHAAVRWSDRVLTVSRASKRDLIEMFKLPEHRIGLITEGPAPQFRKLRAGEISLDAPRKYGVDPDRRYLLYVGGLSPHKNLLRLIQAHASVTDMDLDLVIVGDFQDVFHTQIPELRAAVATSGQTARVRFTGYVPDTDLVHLYNQAYALIQPSLLEGFGLPPVEAMACGVPVLASRAGSLPEVVGDAGLFFEPTRVDEIAHAIRQLANDREMRDRLAALALAQSAKFTWTAAAAMLLDHFAEVGQGRAPKAVA